MLPTRGYEHVHSARSIRFLRPTGVEIRHLAFLPAFSTRPLWEPEGDSRAHIRARSDEPSMISKVSRRLEALFTEVRGRGILRTSIAESCIERPPRGESMPSEATHAAWEGTIYCGAA